MKKLTKKEQKYVAEKDYHAIVDPAWKAYCAVEEPARKARKAIIDGAEEALRAKIKEIVEQPDEGVKI